MANIFRTAVFPGSFDPFTIGHLDVLKAALKIFDKVIVAVGYNHTKKGFMDPAARVRLIEDTIKTLKDTGAEIEVTAYTGLTVDFCIKAGAGFIVRGLRSASDLDSESVIAQANELMKPEVSTVFIPAKASTSFISSTVVRDVFINGGDTSPFMPENIKIENYIK